MNEEQVDRRNVQLATMNLANKVISDSISMAHFDHCMCFKNCPSIQIHERWIMLEMTSIQCNFNTYEFLVNS